MSSPISDKELDALYRQRKQGIKAPDINLANRLNQGKGDINLVLKISTILGVSCFASFSIFALIVHFAQPEKQVMPTEHIVVQRNSPIVDPEHITKQADHVLTIKPSLKKTERPTLPAAPKSGHNQPSPINTDPLLMTQHITNVSIQYLSKLPTLSIAHSALQLNVKILPKYPTQARKSRQEGKVRLSYRVNSSGLVTNINVLKAMPKRVFNKSAIKALSQWKYHVDQDKSKTLDHRFYEIEFIYKINSD
jgi:protein TonB